MDESDAEEFARTLGITIEMKSHEDHRCAVWQPESQTLLVCKKLSSQSRAIIVHLALKRLAVTFPLLLGDLALQLLR